MSSLGYNLEDLSSTGAQIIKLIRNEIYNNITTAYLAEVTGVAVNTAGKAVVDIKLLNTGTFNGEATNEQEIFGVPVGIMGVKGWLINLPIQKGDIGLCIACKWDISGYMDTGTGGNPPTGRTFNIVDSIFIPLSMYLQPEIKEDLILTETGAEEPNLKITFKSDGTVEFMNKKNITVDSGGDVSLSVKGDYSITVDKNYKQEIKGDLEYEATGNLTLKGQKVTIDAPAINLGDNPTSPAPLGDKYLEYLTNIDTFIRAHTHTGNMGAPTSPPVPPPTFSPPTPALNSTIVKVK